MSSDESQRVGNQQSVGATQCDYTKVGKQTGNLHAFASADVKENSFLDRFELNWVRLKVLLDIFVYERSS